MKIEPYKRINAIELNLKESELLESLGDPKKIAKNSIGLVEYDFNSQIFRFDSSGELNEVTVYSENVEIEGLSIPFDKLVLFVKKCDCNLFEKFGFIVSPKYGLAFDPEFFAWVTVLTSKGLVAWKKV